MPRAPLFRVSFTLSRKANSAGARPKATAVTMEAANAQAKTCQSKAKVKRSPFSDKVLAEIQQIQSDARTHGFSVRPRWPMIVLRSPKGWTGPKEVDGKPTEDSWRSHQVPLSELSSNPQHLKQLEEWLESYRPNELFDEQGRLVPELAELAPTGERRMGANPHANGGKLLNDLRLPDFREYAVEVKSPGSSNAEATRIQGIYIRDVLTENADRQNFRL